MTLASTLASAHDRDVMTAGGRVGPIQTGETTVADMEDLFGEPRSRDVVRVGCSRVLRLRWHQIQTYSYRGEKVIVDVRVRSDRVRAESGAYRFHTKRDLVVGDSEARLRELYPRRKGITHAGHTHYVLAEANQGPKLLAKVVDGTVTELEAAPYEFC